MITGLLDSVDIEIIHGRGKFVDAHTIEVDQQRYTADKIVIANGATSPPSRCYGLRTYA